MRILFYFGSLWRFFFVGFNFLEAALPTLLAERAPYKFRGVAMGGYTSIQFLGIFFGGIISGYVFEHYGVATVCYFCTFLSIIWLSLCIRWGNFSILSQTVEED